MLYMNWTIVLLTIAAIRHVRTVRAVENVKSWYGRHGRDTGEADREHDFSRSKDSPSEYRHPQ
uniref:AlNc14C55G4220 protein n=1 Tax=Albugo laibachii Nc14 TaxID=890382 RepID=F0WC36_9STRA|nr:AlNc14C55G4220 [Albugo laibachii Nc14]|eukprot:CCA18749.1 AlNc14C55G4220 [Albugo laibachii Nc14]